MTYLNNIEEMKMQRRFLRNNSTFHERRLWQEIRNKKLGYKFRRQQSIGHYIVDFCCLREKLIIEIDGENHNSTEAREYDLVRTEYFNSLGFREIRFKNEEIDTDLENVVGAILKAVTSPYEGEAGGVIKID
ncbi:MAG: DUF559 domain-containing protein [bacterium]|nr:DUF559 domain-containing protein [bacterium]